jgi:S1-C subfamily serine protease
MPRAFLLVLVAACNFPAAAGHAQTPPITASVVKLGVLRDLPDLENPWQTQGVEPVGGSGVIIDGNRILTNAHVVESAPMGAFHSPPRSPSSAMTRT